MAKRDYYDILGIPRGAPADEIKAAYRKLARKLHPDVSKEPDAQARFAELQEAYDVLSDPEKRKVYDRFGHAAPSAGAGRSSPGQPGGFEVDLDDLGSMFDAFFGKAGAADAAGHPGGFRTSSRPGRAARRPAPPVEVELSLSFRTAALGGSERVRLSVAGKDSSLEVRIPPAIEEGARLRVRGVDGRDVLLRVKVGGHPLFRRGEGADAGKGLDLSLDLPLTISEATLGASVRVPTINGTVDLTVPAGSPSGRQLRVKGKGLRDPSGREGDLYAIVKIIPPEASTLTSAEREMLEQIGRRTPDPRSGNAWPASSGAAEGLG